MAHKAGARVKDSYRDAVTRLLNHIEDVVSDADWEKIDAKLWNAVTQHQPEPEKSEGWKQGDPERRKDTPRTDAAWKEHYHLASDGKVMSFAYRLAEEMRKLERELASLRPELSRASAIEECRQTIKDMYQTSDHARDLIEVTRILDALLVLKNRPTATKSE